MADEVSANEAALLMIMNNLPPDSQDGTKGSSSRPKREALAVTTNVHTPPSKAATKASQTPRSSNKARGADQAGDDPPFASPRSQMLSEVLVSLSKPKKPRVRNIAAHLGGNEADDVEAAAACMSALGQGKVLVYVEPEFGGDAGSNDVPASAKTGKRASTKVPRSRRKAKPQAAKRTRKKTNKWKEATAKAAAVKAKRTAKKKKKRTNSEPGSRKEKSLARLCERFIAWCEAEREVGAIVHLPNVAKQLGVERRRIYDLVNVLECISAIVRRAKNQYQWLGFDRLNEAYSFLKRDALATFGRVDESKDDESNSENSSADKMTGPGSQRRRGRGKDRSLTALADGMLKLYLLENPMDLTLEDAARRLSPGKELSKRGLTAKVRRLYDVANILMSVGILEKRKGVVKRKPVFVWVSTPPSLVKPAPDGVSHFVYDLVRPSLPDDWILNTKPQVSAEEGDERAFTPPSPSKAVVDVRLSGDLFENAERVEAEYSALVTATAEAAAQEGMPAPRLSPVKEVPVLRHLNFSFGPPPAQPNRPSGQRRQGAGDDGQGCGLDLGEYATKASVPNHLMPRSPVPIGNQRRRSRRAAARQAASDSASAAAAAAAAAAASGAEQQSPVPEHRYVQSPPRSSRKRRRAESDAKAQGQDNEAPSSPGLPLPLAAASGQSPVADDDETTFSIVVGDGKDALVVPPRAKRQRTTEETKVPPGAAAATAAATAAAIAAANAHVQ